jgi:hypothetical protein
MSDEDVISRLYEILQIGNLGTYVPRNPKYKQSWMLTLGRREYIDWLLQQLTPLMSYRRRAAITRLANNYSESLVIPSAIVVLGCLPEPAATAWLAGLIEGDGCIRKNEISVVSVDQDVLVRAQAVAQCGQIYSQPRQKPHHRDRYAWMITSRQNIDRTLRAIEPWMLSRRAGVIGVILGRGDDPSGSLPCYLRPKESKI